MSMKALILFSLLAVFLLGACSATTEPTITGSNGEESPPAATATPIDMDSPLARDAQAFAEMEGISLEEALKRLEFQDSIGDTQAAMMNDLSGTFGGLWVEHSPDYRVVIALTDGDEGSIRPYIDGKPWSSFVHVEPVKYSLVELLAAQETAAPAEIPSQTVVAPPKATVAAPKSDGKIRFTFQEQDWQDVIPWFADQAGYSLQPVVDWWTGPAGTVRCVWLHLLRPAAAGRVLWRQPGQESAGCLGHRVG